MSIPGVCEERATKLAGLRTAARRGAAIFHPINSCTKGKKPKRRKGKNIFVGWSYDD